MDFFHHESKQFQEQLIHGAYHEIKFAKEKEDLKECIYSARKWTMQFNLPTLFVTCNKSWEKKYIYFFIWNCEFTTIKLTWRFDAADIMKEIDRIDFFLR